MSVKWVDIVHSETGARARINRDALAFHQGVGWEIDPDPASAPFLDPTDPVATSTPVDDDTPDLALEPEDDDPADTGDADVPTDTKKG